jgi:Mrp family chromosome partitioning ATPase
MPLRQIAARVRGNLWLVPDGERGSGSISAASLHSYLGELRTQFEYSIVQAPSAGESDAATAMALFADGVILVLSAQHTRRAAASKIKAALDLARVRILGAVLSDRAFPIPEAIYRRL